MNTTDTDTNLIDGFLRLLDTLSPSGKLDLISRLTLSVKEDIAKRRTSFLQAFGAWDAEDSPERIIADIHSSRTFLRQTESI